MSRCHVIPEATIHLRGNLRHAAPECHVQVCGAAEVKETESEQAFLRRNWQWSYAHRDYGAFRGDFGRRFLAGMPATEAAAYLEAHAGTWPAHDLAAEVAHFRALALGERVCLHCGRRMRPAPPCDCGCQRPARPVAGFDTIGRAAARAMAARHATPVEAVVVATQPAQEPLPGAVHPHVPTPPEKPATAPLAQSEEDDYARPF